MFALKSILSIFFLFFGIICTNDKAFADDPFKGQYFLFTVKSDAPVGEKQIHGEDTCSMLHLMFNTEANSRVPSMCISFNVDPHPEETIEDARKTGRFKYRIDLEVKSDGSYQVVIENYIRIDTTEFEKIAWNISAKSGLDTQKAALQKRIANLLNYDRSGVARRELLLASAAQFSKRISLGDNGKYYNQIGHQELTIDEAYALFRDENEKNHSFLRASSEIMAGVSMGCIGYWVTPGIQDSTGDSIAVSLQRKLTSMQKVRFDDNIMSINGIGHPVAGALEYAFARHNGFNSLDSMLITFASSSLWEYFVEAQEVVSINDEIFTPVAGAIVGEVLLQFSRHYASGAKTLVNKVLTHVFDVTGVLNSWQGGKGAFQKRNLDGTGFSDTSWSKEAFYLSAEDTYLGAQKAGNANTAFGYEGEIFNISTYEKEGDLRTFLRDTVYSQLIINGKRGVDGSSEGNAFLKASFAGFYKQQISKDENEKLRGYSFFVGLSGAYNYGSINNPEIKDHYAIINVLGPSIDISLYQGDTRVRFQVDVFGDFAMIRPVAIDSYFDAGNNLTYAKQVLRKHDYYFAGGASAYSSLVIEEKNFEIGGRVEYHYLDSYDSADQGQEKIVNNFSLADQRVNLKAWLGYNFPNKRFKIRAGFDQKILKGSMDGMSDKKQERSFYGSLIYILPH